MSKTAYQIKYILWGKLSNIALKLYYIAPREMLQNEFFLLHRLALKRAHTARVSFEKIWNTPESNK